VQRVTDIMGEITAAASEQADGIAQVNAAVAQLDQMTQQNAALVEQSAAAASSMKDQAHRLAGVVATFKLDGTSSAARPPSMATRKASKPPVSAPRKPVASPVAKPALTNRKPAPAVQAKLVAPAAAPASSKASGSQGDDDWETF
jgi:methyl-accepting chemotaxis protein